MEVLFVLLGVAVIGYVWYASIISRRNKALEALSGIDVHLKKRHDLVPNILKIAQRFMEHEKSLLEDVTRLRTAAVQFDGLAGNIKEKFAVEAQLQAAVGKLMVQVENYPQLKSDQTMLQAQATYNEVEEQISAARRFYNAAVNSLNNAIQIFPGSIFARIAGVQAMPFYEAEATERAAVDADAFLRRP